MIQFLSLGEFADRAELAFDTMKKYRKLGLLPPEEGEVGRNRGWLPESADHWIGNRPGRGTRTDLDDSRPPRPTVLCIHFLSLREFADRAGIPLGTMTTYRERGLLPPEDGQVGRNRGWLPETADHWIGNRNTG
ncbi:MAG: hypothetical protein WAW17_21675 [Rhodococcus sp. (in: high G+C Gram-positive bacteria)]|uniref:hypothetical protein n=1 Tax=Rhodococcus sp. TaxID=1831 RepID=UPI003BB06F81